MKITIKELRSIIKENVEGDLLHDLINEIIHKCGGKWCLMTKHKKNGKRRKLGTHSSKASAERQERAIHAHGG